MCHPSDISHLTCGTSRVLFAAPIIANGMTFTTKDTCIHTMCTLGKEAATPVQETRRGNSAISWRVRQMK